MDYKDIIKAEDFPTSENREGLLICSDEASIPIIISSSFLEYNDLPCIVATFIDISSEKQVQVDLEKNLKTLEESRLILINMMEDAEQAREEATKSNNKLKESEEIQSGYVCSK